MISDMQPLEVTVSEFVALFNQTLEYAYPSIVIQGELANFRVSRNRWVYFDLKDENASVKFFGTVYMLPGPLEEGMILKVRGQPRLHQLYGFSVTVQSIQTSGEGTIRRAAELLAAKLAAEGLFDNGRKRLLPYPPESIGLITSRQSAAYADFMKILNVRWRGIACSVIDVQVQGEIAPLQIQRALEQFNAQAEPPDVLVIVRGGGSAEDLAAFSTEQVTRAVAASRVPTLVAIGHEIDLSLAEMAADQRASTPSNAAELLTPDRRDVLVQITALRSELARYCTISLATHRTSLREAHQSLDRDVAAITNFASGQLKSNRQLLMALNPDAILRRGYALVRHKDKLVRSASELHVDAIVDIQFHDGSERAVITNNPKD
jgi:exodeoxyribonuclease VII large subunit